MLAIPRVNFEKNLNLSITPNLSNEQKSNSLSFGSNYEKTVVRLKNERTMTALKNIKTNLKKLINLYKKELKLKNIQNCDGIVLSHVGSDEQFHFIPSGENKYLVKFMKGQFFRDEDSFVITRRKFKTPLIARLSNKNPDKDLVRDADFLLKHIVNIHESKVKKSSEPSAFARTLNFLYCAQKP